MFTYSCFHLVYHCQNSKFFKSLFAYNVMKGNIGLYSVWILFCLSYLKIIAFYFLYWGNEKNTLKNQSILTTFAYNQKIYKHCLEAFSNSLYSIFQTNKLRQTYNTLANTFIKCESSKTFQTPFKYCSFFFTDEDTEG